MENIEDLRLKIHYNLENVDDYELLTIVNDIIVNRSPQKEPNLSQWQIDRINQAKENFEKGNYFTNEQADLLVEKWLNE